VGGGGIGNAVFDSNENDCILKLRE
jgi:hypothetical protein